MNLAVIPARGGSKRIPRKNIKLFAGQPMLAFAISAAKQSGLFDAIVVSSDDEDILSLAEKLGAIALRRPDALADDHTPTVPVITHAITECEKQGLKPSFVCCIYPAVPFLQPEWLSQAFTQLQTKQAEYIFPVAEFSSPIQRALQLDQEGKISLFDERFDQVRTQDIKPAYHDAGQFYWGKKSAWMEGKSIHRYGHGLVVPSWSVIDIDTPDDWERAEKMWGVRGKIGDQRDKNTI